MKNSKSTVAPCYISNVVTPPYSLIKHLRKSGSKLNCVFAEHIETCQKFMVNIEGLPKKYGEFVMQLPYPSVFFHFASIDADFFILAKETNEDWCPVRFQVFGRDSRGWHIIAPKANWHYNIEDHGLWKEPAAAVHEDDIMIVGIVAAMLMTAIKLINCSNVELVKVKPSLKLRSRLNKKRKDFYEYKVLQLAGDKKRSMPRNDGSGISPRFHFRRGHIRKLNSGLSIWVQSCTVGTPKDGMIDKSYVLR